MLLVFFCNFNNKIVVKFFVYKTKPFDCEDLLRLGPGGGNGGSSLEAAAVGGGNRLAAADALGWLMVAGMPSTSLPTRHAAIRLS